MRAFDIDRYKCRQLAANDPLGPGQYNDVAELIYDTDPYIYPALFGDGPDGVKNAARILPVVFESNRDAMFAKGNLFVLSDADEIVGLILWHKGSMKWDLQEILAAARRESILLYAEDVKKVSKEYVDSQYMARDENKNDTISVINVCVKRGLRGCGAATYMMNCFIADHMKENMELTVLADNVHAIELYKKFGFAVVRESMGFSRNNQKPRCFIMERDI